MDAQHVYIVGSKGCGNYGGYETFLDNLTKQHQGNKNIIYHIAWKGAKKKEFVHNGAHSFQIKVPNIGPAQAIYYDIAALNYCLKHIKENKVSKPIVYILACRIGPFAAYFQKAIHLLGGVVYVNPDGHEWMRTKWSALVRMYWKISEQMMVKHADLLVCDSKNIEKYIHETYKKYNPQTIFIAYGADLAASRLANDDEKLVQWYNEKGLKQKNYYLVVGRFVPENSFEIMIREFMTSKSKHDFAIITTADDKYQAQLEELLHYKSDKRIKFVGTVYDQELLKKIRENAFAYCHGHTVGGTNPSLIQALSSTDLNLLVNVGFNQEVAEDSALYWSREQGSLSKLIDKADLMSEDEIKALGYKAKDRIRREYTVEKISNMYEKLFVNRS